MSLKETEFVTSNSASTRKQQTTRDCRNCSRVRNLSLRRGGGGTRWHARTGPTAGTQAIWGHCWRHSKASTRGARLTDIPGTNKSLDLSNQIVLISGNEVLVKA